MTEAPTAQKESNNFEIISDINTYNININLENENIIIKAICVSSLKNEIYENSFSFSQIQNNKYFKMCDNINESYLLLCELANSKEKKIISNSLNQINLVIPINNALVKEINLTLKTKEKNAEDKILELYYLIEKQQKEINFLKNEIEQLKTDKNEKEQKKEDEEKLNYLQKTSLIIGNEPDKEKAIRGWINPYKKIEFNLIFRMSRDGSNCSDIHRFCDNKGETLLLFKLYFFTVSLSFKLERLKLIKIINLGHILL